MDGARQVTLLPLGLLADVDEDGVAGWQVVHLLRSDLADLGAGLTKEVCNGAWHGRWMAPS
jgi:hypothetical protein